MTTQIAVRLPQELLDKMDVLAGSTGGTRSDLVRRAIESYLYREACNADALAYQSTPLAGTELALADDSSGWSTTPAW